MTWSAQFVAAEKRDGRIAFTLLYTDGKGGSIKREYLAEFVDDAFVQKVATEEIGRITSSDQAATKLTFAKDAAVPLVTSVVASQAELDRQAFRAAWMRHQSRQRAVAAGLLSSGDKLVTDAAALVASLFVPAFADEL